MSVTPFVTPLSGLLKTLPPISRVLGRVICIKESPNGLSHTKFAQDTVIAWLPKMLLSRSHAEISEISLLEFVESGLIYYSIPLAGGRIFAPLFRKLSGKHVDPKLLLKPLSEIPKAAQKTIIPIKAGMILGAIALTAIAGEYALNFAKNLITARVFKKSRFSDVINLSDASASASTGASTQTDPVVAKAHRRIKQCMAATAGIITGAALLARFGGNSKTLLKCLTPLVEKFDFAFANGRPVLSRNQMYTYMAIGYAGYIDAARDRLERVEVATRVGLVLGYLAFGQELIDKLVVHTFGKRFPELLSNGRVKTLDQLAREAASPEAFRQLLKAKSAVVFLPMLFGLTVTGLGVGLLSRLWTARRFKNAAPPPSTPLSPFHYYYNRIDMERNRRGLPPLPCF